MDVTTQPCQDRWWLGWLGGDTRNIEKTDQKGKGFGWLRNIRVGLVGVESEYASFNDLKNASTWLGFFTTPWLSCPILRGVSCFGSGQHCFEFEKRAAAIAVDLRLTQNNKGIRPTQSREKQFLALQVNITKRCLACSCFDVWLELCQLQKALLCAAPNANVWVFFRLNSFQKARVFTRFTKHLFMQIIAKSTVHGSQFKPCMFYLGKSALKYRILYSELQDLRNVSLEPCRDCVRAGKCFFVEYNYLWYKEGAMNGNYGCWWWGGWWWWWISLPNSELLWEHQNHQNKTLPLTTSFGGVLLTKSTCSIKGLWFMLVVSCSRNLRFRWDCYGRVQSVE